MSENKRTNILFITGGEGKYHDIAGIGNSIEGFLKNSGFDVTKTEDLEMLQPGNIKNFDVIINNTTNSYITEEQEASLINAVKSGQIKGFIGIHAATITFKNSAKYMRMIGGSFLTHPQIGEVFTFNVDRKDHPVMRGVKDFKMAAELYLMEEYPPFDTLLSVDYLGFKRPVAWVKPYGFGRVFYLSLGHNIEEIENENFRTIVVNAVNWCCTGK